MSGNSYDSPQYRAHREQSSDGDDDLKREREEIAQFFNAADKKRKQEAKQLKRRLELRTKREWLFYGLVSNFVTVFLLYKISNVQKSHLLEISLALVGINAYFLYAQALFLPVYPRLANWTLGTSLGALVHSILQILIERGYTATVLAVIILLNFTFKYLMDEDDYSKLSPRDRSLLEDLRRYGGR